MGQAALNLIFAASAGPHSSWPIGLNVITRPIFPRAAMEFRGNAEEGPDQPARRNVLRVAAGWLDPRG